MLKFLEIIAKPSFKLGKLSFNEDQIETLNEILKSAQSIFETETLSTITSELVNSELSELDRAILTQHEAELIVTKNSSDTIFDRRYQLC